MAEDGKRKNLGRGLDALFGEDADDTVFGLDFLPVGGDP